MLLNRRKPPALVAAVLYAAVVAGGALPLCAQSLPTAPEQGRVQSYIPERDIPTERRSIPGLVGQWRFDGPTGLTTPDAMGSNDGRLVGFATPRWPQGQVGRALEFNGASTNVVVIPNAPALNPAGQITLSAWIYSSTVGSAHPEIIVSKGVGEEVQYSLVIERGGVLQFTLGAFSLSSTTKIAPNSWTHVLASFDGATMRLYLNGEAEPSSFDRRGPIAATEGEVLIGSTANARQPDTFNGLIDDVRIYWMGLNFASVTNLFNEGVHNSTGAIQTHMRAANYGDRYSMDTAAAANLHPQLLSWWQVWQESLEAAPLPPGSLWAAACNAPIDATGKLLTCFLQKNPNIAGAMIWRKPGSKPQTEVDVAWAQWDAQSKTDLAQAFYYAFQWMNGGIQSFNGYNLVDPPVNQFTQPDAAPAITEFDPKAAWHLYVNTIAQNLAVEIGYFVPWSITGYSPNELQSLFDSNTVVSLELSSSNVTDMSIPLVWGYVPAGDTMDAPPTTYFQFLVKNNIIQGNHKSTIDALINWSRYNLLHIENWDILTAVQFEGWWNYRGSSPGSRVLSGTLGPYDDPIPPYPPGMPHNWVFGCHGVVTLYRGLLRTVNIPTDYVIEFGHGMPIWWTVSESLSHGDDVESQIFDKSGSEPNSPGTWEKWPKYAPADQYPISVTDFNDWFLGANANSLNVGRQGYEMLTIKYPDADLLTMYCSDKAHGLSPANGTVLASMQQGLLIQLFPFATLESMGFWNTLASESAQYGFCAP